MCMYMTKVGQDIKASKISIKVEIHLFYWFFLPKKLVKSTKRVTFVHAINYEYNILNSNLKNLFRIRLSNLYFDNLPTLKYIYIVTNSIIINLIKKEVSMSMMVKVYKTVENIEVVHA